MLNVEGEMLNGARRDAAFNIQHSTFNIPALCFALVLSVSALFANDLSVDKRVMQLDDTLTITITLEDSFASIDPVRLPLRGLVIDGQPSVSSEFDFINGQTSRRKTLRYVAHATAAGEAVIGPLTLHGTGGQVETLAPITIQVLADAAAGSNDPAKILHEMIATNRDPIFVVATADKSAAFEGEEIIVTWTLYNATSVQQYAISEIPKLEDFWTEELDVRGEQPQQVMLEGMVLQKLPIRRVAIFPLRSGSLTVPAMGVNASILKRIRASGPFDLFEGMEVDVHRRSAPLNIHARAVPPGAPIAAVGDVTMRCGVPVQKNGGPVTFTVALNGRANLRGAQPPHFVHEPGGSVQIIEQALNVDRRHEDAMMSRQWEYVIFPPQSGSMTVPAVTATVLTEAGTRQVLRCEAATLAVNAASPNEPPPALVKHRRPIDMQMAGMIAVGLLLALSLAGLALLRARRSRRIRHEVRALVKPSAPETRTAVDDYLSRRGIAPSELLREASERGDAYRSLRSLLDALERDRLVAGENEIAQRVRDLVTA
jgi:oxygen tolerance protein BatD